MNDLISRQAAVKALQDKVFHNLSNEFYGTMQVLDELPPVDAEPVAHIKELEEENKALKLLIEWAEECDFGYDNFPEEYERYKDEIEGMGYTEGMIHIAKRVYQEKSKKDGGAENETD